MTSALSRFGALLLATALVLAGCSGGGDDKDEKADEGTTVAPETDENGFTAWGAELEFGDAARVPWSPKQKLDGEVEITVTKVEQAPMKAFEGFKLTKQQKKGAAYYVHAKVENLSEENLSGFTLPLYLDDGSETIYPPVTIPAAFDSCAPRTLPEKFKAGKKAKVCMVFLSAPNAQLRAVALQPADGVTQIEWTGALSHPKKGNKKGDKKKARNAAR